MSVSIVDTDNCEQTLACLSALYTSTRRARIEVIVVDNGSSDGSAAAIEAGYPSVTVLRNDVRLGFASNNNRAFELSTGRYLMLLNDDTLVQQGAVDTLVDFLDANPEVGAVGAQLLNPDGSRQHAWEPPPRPFHDALEPLGGWISRSGCDPIGPRSVGSVSGACMAVRRSAAETVGLLDTDFDPLYAEETEWCLRLRRAGWLVFLVPDALVIHLGSQTMNRAPLHRVELLYRHKALLFRKHFGKRAVLTFKCGLVLASLVKLVGWFALGPLLGSEARHHMRAHAHVARRAASF